MTTEPLSPAEAVIQKFGGITPLANALGHKNKSTVQGWKARGFIPIRQIPAVLAAAERNAIPLGYQDCVAGIGTGANDARPIQAVS